MTIGHFSDSADDEIARLRAHVENLEAERDALTARLAEVERDLAETRDAHGCEEWCDQQPARHEPALDKVRRELAEATARLADDVEAAAGFDRKCGLHDRPESATLACRECVQANADETDCIIHELRTALAEDEQARGEAREKLSRELHRELNRTVTDKIRRTEARLMRERDAAEAQASRYRAALKTWRTFYEQLLADMEPSDPMREIFQHFHRMRQTRDALTPDAAPTKGDMDP